MASIYVASELDIDRAANELIKQQGDEVFPAAMMADKMLKRGDLDGLATWKQTTNAIDDLRSADRPAGKDVQ